MSKRRFVVEHEFDDEPTYVIDKATEEAAVTLHPSIPWKLRQKIAKEAADTLDKEI